ncbi:hypothetical protein BH18CHL2_BH18CHL2_11890 [soil metagenome]
MRRGLLLLLVAATALACAPADPAARLGRALAAMEALPGMRFQLDGSVDVTGETAPGGPLRSSVRMAGEYAAPDRLHVAIDTSGAHREVVLIERRTWIDDGGGYHQSVRVPVGPLRDARAPLTFIRGSGAAQFAGLGLSRGSLTYRVRLDLAAGDLAGRLLDGQDVPPDACGTSEVEICLSDDLIRRQRVEIVSSADAFGSGLDRVRTVYTVEYWAFGERADIGEPN